MISLPRSKKLVFLSRVSLSLCWLIAALPAGAQSLAAFHDNQERFYIFDEGKITMVEHLPVKEFSVGGQCILYTDNRNRLRMYFRGEVTTLEVTAVDRFEALDYLAVYSIGGIVKVVEQGRVTTISTYAIQYLAEDSLVAFYDGTKSMVAAYYKGRVNMLEDGLAGQTVSSFRAGDNVVAYVSRRTGNLTAYMHGRLFALEPFLSGGVISAGRGIVAWVSQADQQFKVFFDRQVTELEPFAPASFRVGDELTAYVDHNGVFKIFSKGELYEVESYAPDSYEVHQAMVIYTVGDYLYIWQNGKSHLVENRLPDKWLASWNTVVYRDQNRNVKVFSQGDTRVLTYDLAQQIYLYRDVIVVDKGMKNHNVYFGGKKY